MVKCTCGGEISTRSVLDESDGAIIHEGHCLKCGRIHDRQFAGFKDIHFTYDCIKENVECPFLFGTKCGAHAVYPDDYEFPKRDFVCVYDIPKPEPKPKQLKISSLR